MAEPNDDSPRLRNPEEELEEETCDTVDEGSQNWESGLVNPEEALELAAEGIDLTEHFAVSLSPNGHNLDDDACEKHPDAKKLSMSRFDPTLSQKRRREMTLEWQRKRRDDIIDKIRQLETDSGVSDSEPEDMDFVEALKKKKPVKISDVKSDTDSSTTNGVSQSQGSQSSSWRGRGERGRGHRHQQRNYQRRSAPCGVMLSEWLLEKPANFEDEWLGVLCPVGKRTLVVACRGKTKVFTRTNHYLGQWQSMLPGGRKVSYSVMGNRGRGVTILDCIWSEESQIFYVLDLICWNSHSCGNCDTEYRQFFLMSKFYEHPELLTPGPTNPIPFMPLPFFKAETLPMIMTSIYPPFPEMIDGILFFHKEAFYITETNPLCLWLLLSDVPTRLAIDVNPELLTREKKASKKKKKDIKMSVEVQH